MQKLSAWLWSPEKRIGEPITGPYIALLVAVGSAVLGLILPLLDVKGSLYWGSALALIFLWLIAHFFMKWDKTINLRPFPKTLLILGVAIAYGFLVGRQVLAKWREEHAVVVTLEQKYKQIQSLRIRDLYKNDFDHTTKLSMGSLNGVVNGAFFTAEMQLYQNHYEHSCFVGFYIPENEKTVLIAESIASRYSLPLTWDSKITSKTFDTSQTISSKNLTFTKRVFIYHEHFLDPSDVAAIQKYYDDMGLAVVLRGPEYLAMRTQYLLTLANAERQK